MRLTFTVAVLVPLLAAACASQPMKTAERTTKGNGADPVAGDGADQASAERRERNAARRARRQARRKHGRSR